MINNSDKTWSKQRKYGGKATLNQSIDEEIRKESKCAACIGDEYPYTPEFKLAAQKAYEEGETPAEIIIKAGFDLDLMYVGY